MNSIVFVNFECNESTKVVAQKIWQYDYGQILRIQGLNLPAAVEIHFSLQKTGGIAERRIGVTRDGVTDVVIPDFILKGEGIERNYSAYAFIYLSTEEYGQTEHRIELNIKSRPEPEGSSGSDEPSFGAIMDAIKTFAAGKADGLKYENSILKLMSGEAELARVTIKAGEGTGSDAREIELQKSDTAIQWRYVGDEEWTDLVLLEELKGEKGDPGEGGKTAYQYAQDGGYTGTEEEFAKKLAQENPTREEFSQLSEEIENVSKPTDEQVSNAVNEYLYKNPVSSLDASTAEVNQVPIADGNGSWEWGDLNSEEMANAGSGMTATVKNALLEFAANVAWATAEGQACYDKLKTALNESVGEVELSSITATCSETAQVGTTASDLDIVVTAVYSDGSSAQVTGWTTSGTVVEGTNTFMVSYGGKNTTVTVTGVNAVTVMLENYTKSVTQLKSTTYTDDGNTPVASSGWWYINTNSGAFIQSTPLDEDVTVNISCIPDANCYNGAWVGQVDDGYGLVPSGENAAQTNVYYYKSIASQMLVDTEYSLSNYTIKSGYRLIWNSGGENTVTPTVEVVS